MNYLTIAYFTAYNQHHKECWITDTPMMRKHVKSRIRTICNTALIYSIEQYEIQSMKKTEYKPKQL